MTERSRRRAARESPPNVAVIDSGELGAHRRTPLGTPGWQPRRRQGEQPFGTIAPRAHGSAVPMAGRGDDVLRVPMSAAAAARSARSSATTSTPVGDSRYRWRGGRPRGASRSQAVSTWPRSASRIRMGYIVPALSPSRPHKSYPWLQLLPWPARARSTAMVCGVLRRFRFTREFST